MTLGLRQSIHSASWFKWTGIYWAGFPLQAHTLHRSHKGSFDVNVLFILGLHIVVEFQGQSQADSNIPQFTDPVAQSHRKIMGIQVPPIIITSLSLTKAAASAASINFAWYSSFQLAYLTWAREVAFLKWPYYNTYNKNSTGVLHKTCQYNNCRFYSNLI